MWRTRGKRGWDGVVKMRGLGLPYRKVSLCRTVLEGWLGGFYSDPGKR